MSKAMQKVSDAQLGLRKATAKLHQQLDRLEVLQPLRGIKLNEASYRIALEQLLTPHAFLEKRVIMNLNRLDMGYSYQARAHLLRQDLKLLNSEISELSLDFGVEMGDTLHHTIGYLYLLEGSKLGSETIARRLSQSGFSSYPHQFFADLRAKDSWQTFLKLADSYLVTPTSCLEAEQAACKAFSFYIQTIEKRVLNVSLLLD